MRFDQRIELGPRYQSFYARQKLRVLRVARPCFSNPFSSVSVICFIVSSSMINLLHLKI
jgi:hypothetical protein